MLKKTNLVVVVSLLGYCCTLYWSLGVTSVRFENSKSVFNSNYFSKNNTQGIQRKIVPIKRYYEGDYINPLEIELYLRSQLIQGSGLSRAELLAIILDYQALLKEKPTWPYYYSGLLQAQLQIEGFEINMLSPILRYGPFEKKVVLSVSEILFYNWGLLSKASKDSLLSYLASQSGASIDQIITISAKFAKVIHFCDFLYQRKQVEYAACNKQYWKPVLTN